MVDPAYLTILLAVLGLWGVFLPPIGPTVWDIVRGIGPARRARATRLIREMARKVDMACAMRKNTQFLLVCLSYAQMRMIWCSTASISATIGWVAYFQFAIFNPGGIGIASQPGSATDKAVRTFIIFAMFMTGLSGEVIGVLEFMRSMMGSNPARFAQKATRRLRRLRRIAKDDPAAIAAWRHVDGALFWLKDSVLADGEKDSTNTDEV